MTHEQLAKSLVVVLLDFFVLLSLQAITPSPSKGASNDHGQGIPAEPAIKP